MINLIRQSLICPAVLVLAGCASGTVKLPEQPLMPAPDKAPFTVAVNVFSSYISDAVEQQCRDASLTQTACKNDGIPANEFLAGLERLNLFTELSPSVSRHDYELLIANQVADTPLQENSKPALPLQSFSEFSVEWRGVQLDSFVVHYWHQGLVTQHDIEQIILRWTTHASEQSIFSTPYLYQAMGASDYTNKLVLPDFLGEFQLARQYLYPDPFKGVLARYLHPTFSEAVIDISIYPVLAPLSGEQSLRIGHELEDAVDQARQIAVDRAMAMQIMRHQQPFEGVSPLAGVMSEITAESDSGEALYASIYVFQLEDKFVKFSTTFPSRIADPLVSQALNELSVPPQSALMKELRKAL